MPRLVGTGAVDHSTTVRKARVPSLPTRSWRGSRSGRKRSRAYPEEFFRTRGQPRGRPASSRGSRRPPSSGPGGSRPGSAGVSASRGAPTRKRRPRASTPSRAEIQAAEAPWRNVRALAALLAASPPEVHQDADEGRQGRNRPFRRASSSMRAAVAAAPDRSTVEDRGAPSHGPTCRSSGGGATTTPVPRLPPGIPVPPPRGINGTPCSAAHRTSRTRSAVSLGVTYAAGRTRKGPETSEAARSARSLRRTSPRKPAGSDGTGRAIVVRRTRPAGPRSCTHRSTR